METTIKRQLKGVQMEQLFDAQHEQFMIKFYNAQEIKNDEQYNRSKVYNFEIIIRHADNEKAEKLFDDAKNKMFPKRKSKKLFQLVSFANAFNKRTKKWESLRSVTKVYVGNEGLLSAKYDFETEKNECRYLETCNNWNKYSEVRAKVEINIPHIHENGTLAYFGKAIKTYNPNKI